MAKSENTYAIMIGKNSKCLYILNKNDKAISRRIYIGLEDEHLKAIKAIKIIETLRERSKDIFRHRR